MAYEPKTWQCGETVTADDLNHIEQGVAEASEGAGSGLFAIHENVDTRALDKSWEEIMDAVSQGKLAYVMAGASPSISVAVVSWVAEETEETVVYIVRTEEATYSTIAPEGYPTAS